MKKILLPLLVSVMFSTTLNASIYEYVSENNIHYYTERMPKGLTDVEKSYFQRKSVVEVDALTPITLSNREAVKKILRADLIPEPTPDPEPTPENALMEFIGSLEGNVKGVIIQVTESLPPSDLEYLNSKIESMSESERAEFKDKIINLVGGLVAPISQTDMVLVISDITRILEEAPTPTPTPVPSPSPAPDAPLDFTKLEKCADEGGDGCWFPTEKQRTFYLVSGNQWESKETSGWGTSCNLDAADGFPSADIKEGDAKACYVEVEETQAPTPTPSPTPTPTPTPSPGDDLVQMMDTTPYYKSKIPEPVVGYSDIRIAPTDRTVGLPKNSGQFRIHCGYSHMNNDDPIIDPIVGGNNHLHVFFGNTDIKFDSDLDNLKNFGNSTCNGGIVNRSSYWAPALIDTKTGAPIKPKWALFYYKSPSSNVVFPPDGLRMIAGNAKSTGSQWPNPWTKRVRWTCNGDFNTASPFIVPCSGELDFYVEFPRCWDGKNLDSPDHKSHMAFSTNGVCPATHPVIFPDITFNIHYATNDTSSWRLSSDRNGFPAGSSIHADYVFGWDKRIAEKVTNNCLKAKRDCHADLLGDGTWLY